ncbi:MAG: hypothetical protein WDO15_09680 [Bacteroidota bacterium]
MAAALEEFRVMLLVMLLLNVLKLTLLPTLAWLKMLFVNVRNLQVVLNILTVPPPALLLLVNKL